MFSKESNVFLKKHAENRMFFLRFLKKVRKTGKDMKYKRQYISMREDGISFLTHNMRRYWDL